jgi:protein O-mannosyl-transferase
VAWLSELKNTLSAVCYFGSALAYLRFDRTKDKAVYAGALLLFVLGLLAKTVIATLPAALLVVFWWQRGKLSWKQDVLGLIPFFAIAITAGLFTSWMERQHVGAQGSGFNFSIVERFLIAGRAVWFYLGKLFWPTDLIFSYPRWNVSQTIWWQYLFSVAAALLLGALWALRRKERGPLAALLFFIGTLFPALGFVNVYPFKFSFVADHFQYIACCGPIVAASVGIHGLFQRFARAKLVWEPAFCAVVLATLSVLTWRQSRMYSDIQTLWQTTIARNPGSWLAQGDLGAYLLEQGKVDEAIARFRTSLQIQPDNAEAENNLGAALAKNGQLDEAIFRFRNAVARRPNFAEAENNLGHSLLQKGQVEDAISEFQKAAALRPDLAQYRSTLAHAHFDLGAALRQKGQNEAALLEFQEAVKFQPDFAEAQNDLGNSLLRIGRADEAIAHLQKALEVQPAYAQAHYNLGNALLQKGQLDGAIDQFQKLLAIQPESTEARNTLAGVAWRLATSPNPSQRNGTKAIELAEQTDKLAHGTNPMMAAILAAAYAESGRFDQAVVVGRRSLQLAMHEDNKTMTAAIQAQLTCYEAGSPFRDTGPSP